MTPQHSAVPEHVEAIASRADAGFRLSLIERAEGYMRAGEGKAMAVYRAVNTTGRPVAYRSLWRWFSWVAGAPPSDRLSHLTTCANPQTVAELKAFRALWGKASASGRAAILHDLAGRKLPEGYSVTGGGE